MTMCLYHSGVFLFIYNIVMRREERAPLLWSGIEASEWRGLALQLRALGNGMAALLLRVASWAVRDLRLALGAWDKLVSFK